MLSDATSAGLSSDGKSLADGGTAHKPMRMRWRCIWRLRHGKAAVSLRSLCKPRQQIDPMRGFFGGIANGLGLCGGNPVQDSIGQFLVTVGLDCEVLNKFTFGSPLHRWQSNVVTGPGWNFSWQLAVIRWSLPTQYYDNIGYADLSDFFYVAAPLALKSVFPDLFATLAVPKAEELVATPYRHGGKGTNGSVLPWRNDAGDAPTGRAEPPCVPG